MLLPLAIGGSKFTSHVHPSSREVPYRDARKDEISVGKSAKPEDVDKGSECVSMLLGRIGLRLDRMG